MKSENKSLIIWLLTGCLLIFTMVIIGGITRLTHSGLSIVEWKLLTGTLPPLSDAEWTIEFEKYKTSPEFKELNTHFKLSDFKSIFWWEYIHRLLGRIIGFVFVVPFIVFKLQKKITNTLSVKLLVIFLLGAFQGFLGWYMVKSGLVSNPSVSHYRLAAHLVTAFITCGYIFWVAMELRYEGVFVKRHFPTLRMLSMILIVVIVLQLIYGAFVAGLKAGLVYNTFPMMENEWIAKDAFALQPFYTNLIENRACVQFIHRLFGVIILLLSTAIFILSRGKQMLYGQRFAVNTVFILVIIQVIVGISTLLLHVPLGLGVLHQAIAFVIFIGSLFMRFRLKSTSLGVA